MKKKLLLSAILPVLMTGIVVATPAFAQADQAGQEALSTMEGVITGNIGLLIGLGMVIIGLLTWVFSGKAVAGITLILGGALFTLSPGIFNGVRSMVFGIVEQFGNGSATTVNQSNY